MTELEQRAIKKLSDRIYKRLMQKQKKASKEPLGALFCFTWQDYAFLDLYRIGYFNEALH